MQGPEASEDTPAPMPAPGTCTLPGEDRALQTADLAWKLRLAECTRLCQGC